MSSEPIKHLQKVLKAFSPTSVPPDATFLPDQESYPARFSNGDEGKSMKSALNDATGADPADFSRIRNEMDMTGVDFFRWKMKEESGRVDYDLYDKVKGEFYGMAEDLETAFNGLAKAVDGPDGLAETARNLIGMSKDEMGLLTSLTTSLAYYHNSLFEGDKAKTEAPIVLDPRILVEAFANVRKVKTRLSAIEGALEKLSGLEKSEEWDKFIAHKNLFSPPYGNNGKILTESLLKVTDWYMNRKKNREILFEAHQHGLDVLAEDKYFQDYGYPKWAHYSLEYLRRNLDVSYNLMDMAWVRPLTGPNIRHTTAFKDGIAGLVINIEAAQVVDGQVEYPEISQDVTKFSNLMKDAYEEDRFLTGNFDDQLRICMIVAKQESLRKAMLREADLEDTRKDASEVFQKLCRCQQASYAAASELGNGMIRLMNFINDVVRPDVLDMASTLGDIYCNLIAEDFGSALEDQAEFDAAYGKFQDDLNSFNGMFQ